MARDDFSPSVKNSLKMRAAFICSNPDCKKLTIAPTENDETKVNYIAKAAHITAASEGGPRYDSSLTPDERSSISNAIFLCSNCADLIDKNDGFDYPTSMIKKWKVDHEIWIRNNLNKQIKNGETLINVTSINQKGGITAGIINVGKPKRVFDEPHKSQLIKLIEENKDKFENISISAQMGCSECYEYGEQIQTFLKSIGYSSNLGTIQLSKPLKPIEITIGRFPPHMRTSNLNILIGNQE